MTCYPIVLYPEALQLAWQQRPGLPELLLVEPTPPAAPAKVNLWRSFMTLVVAIAIAAISFPLNPKLSVHVLILSSMLTMGYGLFQGGRYRHRRRIWRQQQHRYEQQLEAYQRRLATHNQLCGEMHHPMAIAEYQHQLVLAALRTATGYDKQALPATNSKIVDFFRPYLEKYFPGKIKVNVAIYQEGYQDFYRCELAYIDDLKSLFIDIEIDEPYGHKTRRPTHCQNNEADGDHNDFFLSHGWPVIRFSEAQVVNTPRRCCRRLAQEIHKITIESGVMRRFSRIPELETYPHWTWQEAKQMAQYGSRDADLARVAAKLRNASAASSKASPIANRS